MKLMSTDELAEHEFPTPDYLVEPMLPQGGTSIIYGKPGVGKTQLVQTLAAAINNNLDLFGRWPVRKGKVVVMQADMSGQIQRDRLLKAIREVKLNDTYWLTNDDGSTPIVDIITLPLLKKGVVEQIKEIDPVLVVWDTLRKIHMLPENASETVVKVYNAAKKVCPLAHHAFLHHSRKESRDPDALDTGDEDFIGSQQWKGAADAMIHLEAVTASASPGRIKLSWPKARTAPPWETQPVYLEMDPRSMLLLPVSAFDSSKPEQAVATLRASRDEALCLVG